MKDARPGDKFRDTNGKLWFCYGICYEPMVFMEEEDAPKDAPPARLFGGINGAMWHGFKRIDE
jgi:hypothetical protein